MMKMEKENRDKWLHVRLTDVEHRIILKNYSATTNSKLSEYARGILLKKPMIAAVRNQSLQDIMAELFKLRNDLNGVANNFNQAVHKLHTLDHITQIQSWLLSYNLDRRKLLKDISDIKDYINKTSEKWLQS